ncbi:NAD(P)-dependent oxidoreductase [Butyricimonas synergistica]|uniref:NAD(P)-dependent oxidoreductase n=1 Tax=Butyricimonas synergistica TaxID=544644 RepID=UPI00036A7959|nr:NAD(P)H-binding protein [Butyricimonas synergistica]
MKIVVFGATGIVGNAVVNEALKKGHEVTILTRDARKVTTRHEHLHVVEGNVTDKNVVRTVLKGQEAVIQTLGIGGKGDGKPTSIVSEANKIIMTEMEQMNVKRLVAISVIGAGNSLTFLPWIYRKLVLPLFMKWFQAIIDDKNRMEPMIKTSGLDWTIVRCTTVKERPATGKVNATQDGKGLKFSISAADMAVFIVNQLTDSSFLKQIPTISN